MDIAGPPGTSRFERIVDDWSDFTTWPTSKKTALAMGIALGFHLVVPTLALIAIAWWAPGLVDVPRISILFTVWLLVIIGIIAVSLVVWWRGREGRWTFHLSLLTYGSFVIVTVMQFGTVSSPWVALPALMILFVPIFFDQRAGRGAFGFVVAALTVACVLELTGTVPFAPVMQMRTLEAQRTPGWYLGVYLVVFGVLACVFLLVQVSVTVREVQQRRLEAAHRELTEAKAALERGTQLIRRYVPTQLAEQLLSGGPGDNGAHQRRTLTVFFSDVEGFTQLVDGMEPEHASQVLNEYLSDMATIAERFGGTVDKFVGDAVMVLFGAPGPLHTPAHAARAVEMALVMQARTAELARKWYAEGIEVPFRVRIGINTGPASVGSFGSAGRMDYTAIGNQVNLAARVQGHCRPGSVLVTHSTWALVKDRFVCEPLGEITVKGIHYPVKVYEVRGDAGA